MPSIDAIAECGHNDYMSRSVTVGTRELKTRLGTYLRRVRSGQTLLVTDRGRPIAEVRPFAAGSTPEDAGLARLKATGAVTQLVDRPLATFRPMRSRKSLSDAVIEDRADRV
ncbi:MAG: type II toxin-antitoxin system prevent-host-death family antitoxin [Luteitalea sp.]|nr:type II toxin-antitoxin system prevent-host-death family antitoxin [Luteitalea sp.]